MNRDDIIRMAREQGLPETEVEGIFRVNTDDLGRLIAAEREACEKACKQIGQHGIITQCVNAIRARGNNAP